ncbi:hypothetical protein ACTHO0_08980 [Cytobacillus praedii]|uniref:hypothetical protein n=1 Tax=Cytobacillus praedii TaxID=1742358 RepID=UPI003F7D1C8D
MRKSYKTLLLIFGVFLLALGIKNIPISIASLDHVMYFKGPFDSPTGKFTADSYFKNWGGATGGAQVLV